MDSLSSADDGAILAPGELARRLIRFDTTSPGGSERELIAWLAPMLEAAGLEVQVLARDPERPNIVARLEGRGEAPPLLLHGHVDVVPVTGRSGRSTRSPGRSATASSGVAARST